MIFMGESNTPPQEKKKMNEIEAFLYWGGSMADGSESLVVFNGRDETWG